MDHTKDYFSVNTLAPECEEYVTVFFKKVVGSKSDGFAVINNGKVFVIDVGTKNDVELISFLLDLRRKWIGDSLDPNDVTAKLELTVIISHAHPDHMGALPLLIDDERFCITKLYAPERSCLSYDVPGMLLPLARYENRFDSICEELPKKGHTANGITRIPYGMPYFVSSEGEDFVLKIYPSHIDWSEDRHSDKEGLRFILSNNSPTYKDHPENGYTNGILNGNSLWVKVVKGPHSVLITGDQRSSDEMLGSMIRYYGEYEFVCDVLKIPHHGEKNYSPYLLSVANPKFTVFTTSIENATPDTVKLCEKMGCVNYYTRDGDLLLRIGQKEIEAFGVEPR
ncbi:MAG: MBL fold metallo-hydrolase [Clostridia bacterium]|nr:MBL fold metallo-hydrolase [Clostridia bacterium]